MKATRLRTNHIKNPLGIDIRQPVLSWIVSEGISQGAYEVSAYCDRARVWSTGKVNSPQMQVKYEGPAKSRARIIWKVTVWDEKDLQGEESAEAYFEYAFLERTDFKAAWINPEIADINPEDRQPASYLVKEFDLHNIGGTGKGNEVSGGGNARIYASAHGVYSLRMNGRRVTGNVLSPGTSEYWFRMPYQTFDVTGYLADGKNKIEVILGDGWYRGCNGNTGTRNVFGKSLAFWMQLEVDGKTVAVTDESWQASQDGPVYFNDIQLGEKVDARKEPNIFHPVKVEDIGCETMLCTNSVPVLEKEQFRAKLIKTPDGGQVLDFGQNMSGYVSFRLQAKAGQKIKMTHGEYLDAGGNFSDENLKTIGRKEELHQVIEYTCKEGENVYCPSLCIFGFQMVRVETDIEIDGSEFIAHAVYSDIRQTADFVCDNELVNRLVRNTVWSQKSNFVDIPMDCPQRERSGWAGDAGVFADTGITLMDGYPVFRRWLDEMKVDQYEDGRVYNFAPRRSPVKNKFDEAYDGSCAWGDAVIIIPYAMYQLTGDEDILRENYDMMKRWIDYVEKKGHKHRFFNRFRKNPYKNYVIDTGIHWGEWLEPDIPMQESVKAMLLHGVPDIATAYYAYSSKMMAEIADILGRTEDAGHYKELAENATKAYNFLEVKDGHISSDRQCRYVRPLYMGLLSEKDARTAAKDLNDLVIRNNYHLNTGFLTTPWLCQVLADYGYVETAYKVLLQEDTPGWLFAVKNGATTIWESWEGHFGDIGVASLNHYSKGAVVSWLIGGICGIHVQGQEITIQPKPCRLMKYAESTFDSPAGMVKSRWEYRGEQVEYTVEIPANTRARFIAPDGTERELQVGLNKFYALSAG
ncbi:MAG: family 78 glycoside hydrolase catalytic domain [Lachnospiraceae bacterium]|nr:family 78 glycoside hydrolase catalytic domain [Lachnospiraceae bacterium]